MATSALRDIVDFICSQMNLVMYLPPETATDYRGDGYGTGREREGRIFPACSLRLRSSFSLTLRRRDSGTRGGLAFANKLICVLTRRVER